MAVPPDAPGATGVTSGGQAQPATAVSRAWTARFTLVWFGYWMATLAPIQLVLPTQLDALDPDHKVRDFGLISGLTGVAALISLPLFGALCDRARSPFGRRRLWTLGGVVVFAAGLLLTGVQTHWVGVGIAWLVASLGMNAASVGLVATIADSVPERQRGMISGAVYGPQAVGIVVGLLIVTAIGGSPELSYLVLAAVLVACAIPFVRHYREVTAPDDFGRAPTSVLAHLRFNPLENPDYSWAFGSRLLVNLGNAFGTTYLFFFLQDGLKLANPDEGLLILTVIYLIFTLVATYVAGAASDRLGRRRVFVAVASVLQAIAALQLALFPSFAVAMVAAGFLGAGYGAFMSVDQALVTQVLPDPDSRAKDLGIMNVGSAAPQALAPLAASLIISSLGGYPVLFMTAAVTTLLGTVMVYRVRSVR